MPILAKLLKKNWDGDLRKRRNDQRQGDQLGGSGEVVGVSTKATTEGMERKNNILKILKI